MAVTVVNPVQTLSQGTAADTPFLHNQAGAAATATITLLKPGGTSFGAVTSGTAARVDNTVYVWQASETDLDTLGMHIVKIVANAVTEYAFVNVIAAAAVTAAPADRPAM